MKLLRMFGIGEQKILDKGCSVKGTVTMVQISRIYVVKKPVRLFITEENTMFSHWITFTYCVNGVTYTGKRWISLRYRCPEKGEEMDVFYDPEKPENYACYAFGPNSRLIGW